VRPEGISTLTPKSVKKKLKSAGFAAKVDRFEIQTGIDLLGVDQTEHIQFIIEVLKENKDELGI
jgi:predicted hydrolase (HD superfamily)